MKTSQTYMAPIPQTKPQTYQMQYKIPTTYASQSNLFTNTFMPTKEVGSQRLGNLMTNLKPVGIMGARFGDLLTIGGASAIIPGYKAYANQPTISGPTSTAQKVGTLITQNTPTSLYAGMRETPSDIIERAKTGSLFYGGYIIPKAGQPGSSENPTPTPIAPTTPTMIPLTQQQVL